MLLRAYSPYSGYSACEGLYETTQMEKFVAVLRDEAVAYLEKKTAELRRRGIEKVSCFVKEGLDADEIISFS